MSEIDPALELSVVGEHEKVVMTQPAARPPEITEDHKVVVEGVMRSCSVETEMLYAGRLRAATGRSKGTMEVVEKMSGVIIDNLPVPMALLQNRIREARHAQIRITVEWIPPYPK